MAKEVEGKYAIKSPLFPTALDFAVRFGFGKVAAMRVIEVAYAEVDVLEALSINGSTVAAHIMKDDLNDLTSFQALEPMSLMVECCNLL